VQVEVTVTAVSVRPGVRLLQPPEMSGRLSFQSIWGSCARP
jgi:hypothetical protein